MKMLRSLTLAAGVFAIAAGAATAAAAWTARTTAGVNVRQGPGVAYPVIITLGVGTLVDVGGCQPSWCWIHLGIRTGWVSSRYLTRNWAEPGGDWPPPFIWFRPSPPPGDHLRWPN